MITTARNAVRKLLTGPATAVRMSSVPEFLKLRVSTGVGLAQPKGGKAQDNKHQCRKDDGPEGIDVDDGIQRNPAQHLGRGIAQPVGHPGVRRLVHADGEQQHHDLKEDVDRIEVHRGLKLILPCATHPPRSAYDARLP